MNRLAFIVLLAILGAAGGNTPDPTSPANTSVTPQTSVILQTPTTVRPAGEGRKLKCYSCPETRYSSKESCYVADQRKTEEECPSSSYICARATYWIRGERHIYQGCINTTSCSGQEYCKMDQYKSNCDVACCGWDLCNRDIPNQCYVCSTAGVSCQTDAITCTSGKDMCVTVRAKDIFFKSCINQAGCNALEKNCDIIGCAVQCCRGNLCNSGIPSIGKGSENGAFLVALFLFVSSTFAYK